MSAGVEKSRLRDGVIRRGSTWSYVIRVTDSTGASKPRWVGGFSSESAAKAARDKARVAARLGDYVDRSTLTVAEYLPGWLAAHALEIKPRTRADYDRIIRAYITPHIGRVKLQDLRPAHINAMYRALLNGGGFKGRPLSGRTVEYVHVVLRKALRDAVVSDQLLPANPADRAKRPRKAPSRQEAHMWTAGQLAAFLGTASEHRLYALFRLAAFTGARRGELLALRWRDLDLGSQPSMNVHASAGIIEHQRVEGTTKSGRARVVSLDARTAAILREHKSRQDEDKRIAGDSWVTGEHIFRMQLGAPIYPDTPSNLMGKLVKAHNSATPAAPLPPMRFHDLRHLHATLLLQAGVPVHVVAARLGHTDSSVTLRVYAHVLSDQASGAASKFAEAMGERVSKSVSKTGQKRSGKQGKKRTNAP